MNHQKSCPTTQKSCPLSNRRSRTTINLEKLQKRSKFPRRTRSVRRRYKSRKRRLRRNRMKLECRTMFHQRKRKARKSPKLRRKKPRSHLKKSLDVQNKLNPTSSAKTHQTQSTRTLKTKRNISTFGTNSIDK